MDVGHEHADQPQGEAAEAELERRWAEENRRADGLDLTADKSSSDITLPDTQGGERDDVDPRRCSHIREDGSRCKGWKVKGHDLCSGHLGLGVAANPKEAASLSAAARSGQAEVRKEARKASLRDLLAARLEERADKIVDRLMDIVDNGSDSDALRAWESVAARVYGKPKETVEIEAKEPASLEAVRAMTPEERRALLRRLDEGGQLGEVVQLHA